MKPLLLENLIYLIGILLLKPLKICNTRGDLSVSFLGAFAVTAAQLYCNQDDQKKKNHASGEGGNVLWLWHILNSLWM